MRDFKSYIYNYKSTHHGDTVDQLRLIRSEGLGPITFHKLIEEFGTATKALEALPDLARQGKLRGKLKIASQRDAETEIERLDKIGGEFISINDPAYPALLRHIEGAPPLLSVLGNIDLLNVKSIGMVGARNASSNGQRLAARISHGLGKAGHATISGLARGIDTAAHHGSIETGTVAVLGCGVDVIYPKENAGLYEEIADKGALVSEIALTGGPQARYFPARNRIISGMSSGIVVIEAAMRSGSLITARYALEQGRDVFAVPGSPQDSRSKGSNNLLRQGAMVTESAKDVLENINVFHTQRRALPGTMKAEAPSKPSPLPKPKAIKPSEQTASSPSTPENSSQSIRKLIGIEPTSVDLIIRDAKIPAERVSLILTEMEMTGQIERLPGNYISLARS